MLFATRTRSPSSAEPTGDHLQVVVASPCVGGLSLVEQHRLVYEALAKPLADGTIHELRIRTKGSQ
jgi:stress-induced morphogen